MFATLTARPRLLTLALALPVLAAGLLHPTWAKSAGVDVWNLSALKGEVRAAAGENSRLDAEDGQVQQRMAVKEALVAELIAGRTTLAEVTARFTEMNVTRPTYMAVIREAYPGATDQEKAARNVIGYASARVPARRPRRRRPPARRRTPQMIAPSATH